MKAGSELRATLNGALHSAASDPAMSAVVRTVLHLADAAADLSEEVARPRLDGPLGERVGAHNADGDAQRRLDILAEDTFAGALETAGVASALSEETETARTVDPEGLISVAIDPLDGSSNIDANAPVGTIFSILPTLKGGSDDPLESFLQPGRRQLAAGFFIYGPQTSLVISVGQGTHLYTLDRRSKTFVLVQANIAIPKNVAEYAINASNARHWHPPIQRYVDDCVMGVDGPRGRDFNMRWIASLVADSYRIFHRGGVFLYPADNRDGYQKGRLRLLYEANPIAFLAEQAGGAATDGLDPILDLVPEAPHQRAPLVMGSADKVERVRRYHLHSSPPTRDAPLFGRRGLLRA